MTSLPQAFMVISKFEEKDKLGAKEEIIREKNKKMRDYL